MKKFNVRVLTILTLMGTLFLACDNNMIQNNEDEAYYAELEDGFMDPPDIAKPKVYWWWLHGSVDTMRIREDLEAFREAGISAVDIFDIGHPGIRIREKLLKWGLPL